MATRASHDWVAATIRELSPVISQALKLPVALKLLARPRAYAWTMIAKVVMAGTRRNVKSG